MASRSSNKTAVPEAKGAMNKFKYEVASELGVPLTDGYNGDLTSKPVQKLSCTVKRTQEMKKRKALGIDPGAFFC